MRIKKVYIVAPGGAVARGGVGRMIGHLTRRLAADPKLPFDVIDTYGPRVNEAGAAKTMPYYFTLAIVRLLGACIRRRIALAHIQMCAYGSVYRKSVMMVICRVFRVPIILHIHGGDLDQFCRETGAWRLRVVRWVINGAREVIVLGEYWRAVMVSTLAVPEERVTVVYNGAPRPSAPATTTDDGTCEILFLGMVKREKGIGELLAALSSPLLFRAPWHTTIAGIGDIAGYQEEAQTLRIADRVDFVGWADEDAARNLLNQTDILVLPSHFECFPMVVIEAMAYGLAVVVTPVGSVREAIVDGETGLLVPVGDSNRLADAIRRLVDDRPLRRRLGQNARLQFGNRFDLDIFEHRIRDIYRKHMIA
jgi:glycosyltransferase involved in cell wall biosynthesis